MKTISEKRTRLGDRNRHVVDQIGDLSTGFLKTLFKLHSAADGVVNRAKQCWLQWVSTSEYVFNDWKAAFQTWMKEIGADPANACESRMGQNSVILGWDSRSHHLEDVEMNVPVTGPSIRGSVGAALGILEADGFFEDRTLDEAPSMTTLMGYKDVRGKHPGDKDYQRMADLADKAGGSESKAIALAQAMAAAIGRGGGAGSREKAHRRAKAALEVFPGKLGKQIAQMFMDAADVKFLPRSTESVGPRGKRPLNGASMRADMNDFTAMSENLDSISDADVQREGETFLAIQRGSHLGETQIGHKYKAFIDAAHDVSSAMLNMRNALKALDDQDLVNKWSKTRGIVDDVIVAMEEGPLSSRMGE